MIFTKKTSSQIEMLKYLGAFAMMFDHVGILFFPTISEFRIIGRFAYPLFGYVLVHNYIFFSTQKLTYIKKLFIFAVLYEPLHYYLFSNHYAGLSIFFMYVTALSFFYIIEGLSTFLEKEKFSKDIKIMVFGLFITGSLFIEYSIMGFLLLLAFYLAFKKNNIITFAVVVVFAFFINYPSIIYSSYTLFFILLIAIVSKVNISIYRNKHFFYIFYPLHILLLLIIQKIMV